MTSALDIRLVEYVPEYLPRGQLEDAAAEALRRDHGGRVTVEHPSPETGGRWRLTSQGWAGHIPLPNGTRVYLRPKVGVGNMFRMLEYAYRLGSFRFLEGLYGAQTLEDFYERLAGMLAQKVLDRRRKGLYKAYVPEEGRLGFVRGRVDVGRMAREPWVANPWCRYQEHTADVEDNQLLAWTLSVVARSGLLSERQRPAVLGAHRALSQATTPRPFGPEDCVGRAYDRLNGDYRSLHALCRLFLEHCGPGHERGDRAAAAFLVDMARLYELFVAEWLKAHLPNGLLVVPKKTVPIDGALRFEIDLVLHDAATKEALCVMDTKYKAAPKPTADDVAQVVAYAEALGCRDALLVYPHTLATPLDARIGNIRVRSASFSLGGDLRAAGLAFLESLRARKAVSVHAPTDHALRPRQPNGTALR